MMRTAIVTDSTAYISPDLRKKYSIHVIPLSVVFGKEAYREEVELTVSDFYEMVGKEGALPTTSQPSVGEFVELYKELSKSYETVVSIHLSSGISGTAQGAQAAGQMVEGIDVHVFDSEISCMIQGFYVLEAAKKAQKGADVNEIMSHLEALRPTSNAYFMVDDLAHLQRGGRLSGAQAFIGGLLQVKPILHFVNKKIAPFEKIRTKKKAIKRLEELLSEAVEREPALQAVIIHANREEEVEAWKNQLAAAHPSVTFYLSYFGPVIGTHLGEGALGMGWMKKSEESGC